MKSLKRYAHLVLALACVVAIAGCQQTAQRTTVAKPAPKPAPSSTGLGMAYPTGDKSTSAIWIEKVFPPAVEINSPFEYIIKVTNLTSLELTDVAVTDQFPANFKLASATPNYQSSEGGKTTWVFNKLNANETKTISVKGSATSTDALTACATVSYNSLLCARIPVVEPALKLVKTMTPEVLSCDPIVATYVVTNTGTGFARDVVVTDKLPDGLMTADGKQSVSFNAGSLAAGESRNFSASLKAAKPGEYTNTANAASGNGLKAEASAKTVVREPMLELVQECPKKEFIGRTICTDVKLTNSGDGVAKNAVLRVVLPVGSQFVSATAGGQFANGVVVWNLGDMAPKAKVAGTVCYKPASQGAHKVLSSAAAYCAKQVNAECVTDIQGIPAILLEVVDLVDPVEVGKSTTYVITATNQGSAIGKNVKITASLEDTQEFVAADGATKADKTGKVIEFAPLATLGVGAKASWRVTVKAVKAGDVRFSVKMLEDQLTRSVDETEATNQFE